MENGLRHLESTQTGTMVPTHRAVYAYALAHEGHFERAAREAALVRGGGALGHRAIFLDGLPVLAWRLFASVDARPRRRSRGSLHTEALDHARQQRAISWELCAAEPGGYGQTMASMEKLQPFLRR